jgi:hypothetical protein
MKPEEYQLEGIAMVDDHLNDWCQMAEDVFGVKLDDEQKVILRSVQFNKKTSVKSGTSRGKDFIAAVAAMCFMYATPLWSEDGELIENTKVFLTAPTGRQVGDIMFPEISQLFRRANMRGFNLPGRLVGYDIRTSFDNWFLTGFKADDTNLEAWTGLHAANIMFVVTEASGISQMIFDSIEGNLSGNSRLLIVFNDNTGIGYASQSQKKEGWAKFRLDSLNAPNVKEKKIIVPGQVNWEWVNERVKDWCMKISLEEFNEGEGDFSWTNEDDITAIYRPNDLFRVKVRGMSPKVSEDVLIPMEWIEIANERWKLQQINKWTITMPLRLGSDIAGMGRDSNCDCHRYGNYVNKFVLIQSTGSANHMESVGRILNTLKQNTDEFTGVHPKCFIDTIGEGAGVYSRLLELASTTDAWLKGKVYSCKNSEAPEMYGKPLKDVTGMYEFLNMRAYLYWAVRDWLNPINKTGAMLPVDDTFAEELTETRYRFLSNGKIQIESKEDITKRLKRSPDKADALANTFYPIADYDIATERKKHKNLQAFAGAFR